jgi:lipopolysaccharide export LptBFGC system permease protein LptF
MTYIAREAELIPVKTGSDLGAAIMLRLLDGSSHHGNLKDQSYEKMEFKVYQLYLQISEGGESLIRKPEMIPQQELLSIINRTTTASFEGREMRGEYWKRFAIAFSPLIFVLLGVGFGSFRHRTAKTGAVLTAFLILSFYWTLQMAGTAAVQKGSLPPILAMQLPNLTMLILGIWGFRRSAW